MSPEAVWANLFSLNTVIEGTQPEAEKVQAALSKISNKIPQFATSTAREILADLGVVKSAVTAPQVSGQYKPQSEVAVHIESSDIHLGLTFSEAVDWALDDGRERTTVLVYKPQGDDFDQYRGDYVVFPESNLSQCGPDPLVVLYSDPIENYVLPKLGEINPYEHSGPCPRCGAETCADWSGDGSCAHVICFKCDSHFVGVE